MIQSSSAVEHPAVNRAVAGSIPASGVVGVAQLVEYSPFKGGVAGSIPASDIWRYVWIWLIILNKR